MRSFLPLLFLVSACGGNGDTTRDGSVDAPSMDAVGHDALSLDAPAPDMLSCHTDADGDGHIAIACGGDDCNDADPNDYPGNHEVCDLTGHDEDCNPATLGPDVDGDGFVSTTCCDTQPSGPVLCGTDCDDTRATVNPSAVETCNGVDDNCNGMIDEGLMQTYYPDCDGDMFGSSSATGVMGGCVPPTTGPASCPAGHWSTTNTDCDDVHAGVNPGAPEVCNGVDDDCNGMTDDGLLMDYYPDCDADGHGAATGTPMHLCMAPVSPPTACSGELGAVWSTSHDDCDDTTNGVHPGVTEICDDVDDDCDPTTFGSLDHDGDGFVSMSCCNPQPASAPLCGTDCDDGDATVHPGAAEICDGLDQNCNRMRDEGLTGCSPASRAHVLPCPTSCNVTSSVCCIGGGSPPALTCTAASCPGGTLLVVHCDGPEDCASGHVCCLTPFGATAGAACAPTAGCTAEVACHDIVDCPAGQHCLHETVLGVAYGACTS